MLLRRAGIEDSVRLADITELYAIAVEPMFAAFPADIQEGFRAAHERARITSDAILQAAKAKLALQPKHRAAEDARRLRDMVEMIKGEVNQVIQQEGRS